jgi:hypothetical protein
MGIFQEMVTVRNLAPVVLNVRFDGQEINVPVGESQLPKICLQHAMNQNPIMGTCDADNPNISGGQYLLVPAGTKYDRQPLSKKEWEEHCDRPCRIDEKAFFKDRLGKGERLEVRGKGRKTHAKSSFDHGVRGAAGAGGEVFEEDR